MVNDAELHADEDKRFHELVSARNQAEALVHSAEKSIKDLGDKLTSDEKSNLESAIADVKAVSKSENVEEINEKAEHLATVSSQFAERLYKGAEGGQEGTASGSSASDHTEEVVDAEFEEVKDDKK